MSARGERLLERDEELHLVESTLAAARAGRGSALVLEGGAGMGRTALLEAVRESADAAGMTVLRARGAELEQDFAFGVVRQLLEPMLRRATAPERAELLDGPAGVAAQVLALPGAPAGRPSDADVFTVLHGMYWLLANLAESRPVCVCVDDADWLDGSSARFIQFVLPRLDELPVGIVLASRADPGSELTASLLHEPAVTTRRLRPLGGDSVSAVIALELGQPPDAAFAAAFLGATGGTPFLVASLAAALRDEGVLPTAAAAGAIHAVEADPIRRWVRLRMSRLPDDARRLAEAVAVLECADPPDAAATLAGLARAEAAHATDHLVTSGILTRTPLMFVHPLVRRVVYGEIPVTDRTTAHGRAALILDEAGIGAEGVATHLLLADPAGSAWAVDRLRAAGRAALRQGAPDSAAAYLRRAVAEPPPDLDRAQVLLELGRAEAAAGDPRGHAHLAAAVSAAQTPAVGVAASVLHARVLSQELLPRGPGRRRPRRRAAGSRRAGTVARPGVGQVVPRPARPRRRHRATGAPGCVPRTCRGRDRNPGSACGRRHALGGRERACHRGSRARASRRDGE